VDWSSALKCVTSNCSSSLPPRPCVTNTCCLSHHRLILSINNLKPLQEFLLRAISSMYKALVYPPMNDEIIYIYIYKS
jgi:hypothetical protein